MRTVGQLPPSSRVRLSLKGWLVLGASAILAAILALMPWPYPFAFYLLFVFVFWGLGLPGGMHYQGDVDDFLQKHPGLSRSDLPWPADYSGLARSQALLYAIRGIPQATAQGLMAPILLLLGGLSQLRIVRESVVDGLFRE
jgi:hypothetical protein